MCYDIKTSLEKQLRRALLDGNKNAVTEIYEKLSIFSKEEVNLYHTSGFDHPKMYIYTSDQPTTPILATWGFVPEWSSDKESIWNKTLNARGETIFDKPVYEDSALRKRCLIFIDGFYEHHHKYRQAFPYFISLKNKKLFAVAGLWSQWKNEEGEVLKTFTIVTTKANKIMSEIHNNPKLIEARMPLILPEKSHGIWLNNAIHKEELEKLIRPFSDELLTAHTVGPIKGRNAQGNIPEVTNEVKYAIIESGEQLVLF